MSHALLADSETLTGARAGWLLHEADRSSASAHLAQAADELARAKTARPLPAVIDVPVSTYRPLLHADASVQEVASWASVNRVEVLPFTHPQRVAALHGVPIARIRVNGVEDEIVVTRSHVAESAGEAAHQRIGPGTVYLRYELASDHQWRRVPLVIGLTASHATQADILAAALRPGIFPKSFRLDGVPFRFVGASVRGVPAWDPPAGSAGAQAVAEGVRLLA